VTEIKTDSGFSVLAYLVATRPRYLANCVTEIKTDSGFSVLAYLVATRPRYLAIQDRAASSAPTI
jgi:hypothetical protein